MRRLLLAGTAVALFCLARGQHAQQPSAKQPIIDMHLHAVPAHFNGPPPVHFCAGDFDYPPVDPRRDFGLSDLLRCDAPLVSASTDAELMEKTLAALERYEIVKAVASGPIEHVRRWRAAAPRRIVPALMFDVSEETSPERLRGLLESGEIEVLGEMLTQYQGLSVSDPEVEPYLALAEELDVPLAVHVGMGPPGVTYLRPTRFRATLTNPLLLEEALIRHPKLRIYVQHAGWPMLDEMIHLLYSHPQVHVDVGIISWGIPRREFHTYLRRLVEAGFGKRILFGSDQIVWPQSIGIAIEAIESAPFLSPRQKRDIFYDNAARFLRLEEPVGISSAASSSSTSAPRSVATQRNDRRPSHVPPKRPRAGAAPGRQPSPTEQAGAMRAWPRASPRRRQRPSARSIRAADAEHGKLARREGFEPPTLRFEA